MQQSLRGGEEALLWTLTHLGAQGSLGCVLAAPERLDAICMEEGVSAIPGIPNAEL